MSILPLKPAVGSHTDTDSRKRRIPVIPCKGEKGMDRLDELSRRRKWAHQKLLSLKSPVYRAFLDMEQAAFSARFALEVMERVFPAAQKP